MKELPAISVTTSFAIVTTHYDTPASKWNWVWNFLDGLFYL